MMHPLDLIACAIIVGYVSVGAIRGVFLTSLWVISFLASYAAGVAAPMFFSASVAGRLEIPQLLAAILVSVVAMFATSILISAIRKAVLRRRNPKPVDGKPKAPAPALSGASRFLGGVLGGLCGIVVTALVGWMYDMSCASPRGATLPPSDTSRTARVSQNVMYGAVYAGVYQGTDKPGLARMVAALVSCPSRTFTGVNLIGSDPDVQALAKEPAFVGAFLAGDEEAIRQHSSLTELLSKEEIVQTLSAMGLIAGDDASAVPYGLSVVGGKIGELVNDPDMRDAMLGLQAEGLLEPGQTAALMKDPRFIKVMDRIAGGGEPATTEDAVPSIEE
jgi:hypothetical protein